MDFVVSKSDLTTALKQILQGRKESSGDVVDLIADRSSLCVVVTGRSIEIEVEAQERGSSRVPISVMFGIKRIIGTYKEDKVRLRISEGKLRVQNTSISDPEITMKKVARRIIDIPDDAAPKDILALPFLFSVDEIEDCGLHTKLLEAQKRFTQDLDSAFKTLSDYGFDRNDLNAMANLKIKVHAETLRAVLFPETRTEQALDRARKTAEAMAKLYRDNPDYEVPY